MSELSSKAIGWGIKENCDSTLETQSSKKMSMFQQVVARLEIDLFPADCYNQRY